MLVLVLIRERSAPDKCVILTHSKGKFRRFVSKIKNLCQNYAKYLFGKIIVLTFVSK